jgi:hypothetical protein
VDVQTVRRWLRNGALVSIPLEDWPAGA